MVPCRAHWRVPAKASGRHHHRRHGRRTPVDAMIAPVCAPAIIEAETIWRPPDLAVISVTDSSWRAATHGTDRRTAASNQLPAATRLTEIRFVLPGSIKSRPVPLRSNRRTDGCGVLLEGCQSSAVGSHTTRPVLWRSMTTAQAVVLSLTTRPSHRALDTSAPTSTSKLGMTVLSELTPSTCSRRMTWACRWLASSCSTSWGAWTVGTYTSCRTSRILQACGRVSASQDRPS